MTAARANEWTRNEWIVADVPELRTIDDELWQEVKRFRAKFADKYLNVTEAISGRAIESAERLAPQFAGEILDDLVGGLFFL